MRGSHRTRAVHLAEGSPKSQAWVFAQALLGNPIPNLVNGARSARVERAQLERLASISDLHRDRLHRLKSEETTAKREREQLEWLAQISEEHNQRLRALLMQEADARDSQQDVERLIESLEVQEARWDPAKHPRRGGPPNAGWFATTGGSSGTTGTARGQSTASNVSPREEPSDELMVTPSMIRSTSWLGGIREKLRVAGDIAGAFVAGLGTGAKAVVNGLATAARSVATLGLNTDQLDLIGVTKEDRERGYDTAVTISTGSGQVLIAVGTGGMASAIAKGGTIARAASGAMVAFDSAGNAVGVVQGVYDASQNGVTLANGTQVAASASVSPRTSAPRRALSSRAHRCRLQKLLYKKRHRPHRRRPPLRISALESTARCRHPALDSTHITALCLPGWKGSSPDMMQRRLQPSSCRTQTTVLPIAPSISGRQPWRKGWAAHSIGPR